MIDEYGRPVPPRKKTSPLVWVGLGCAVALGALVVFVAFIVLIVFGSMRSATPYKDSVARAQVDPRVIAALGRPVKPGLFMSGSIRTQNRDGDANLNIPLSGPKGKGTLHVVARKKRGTWRYEEMVVAVGDREIDLLNTER